MSEPLPQPTYVRELDGWYDSRQRYARRASQGSEIRLARGAYLATAEWSALGRRERYLLRIRAFASTRRRSMVLSHWSAAAIHGLPVIGPWPCEIHVTVGLVSGGRSRNGAVKHSRPLPDEDVTEVDGLLVTTVARTVLDLAVAADTLTAVAAVDRALLVDRFGHHAPLVTREQLIETWERALPLRGHVRSRRMIDFGETRSESPLESVSRANMRIIGCPRPLLQRSFFDHAGFIADVDFSWPELEILGEADGAVKYLDAELRAGKTAGQVVLDEKFREDRLRALHKTVTRWPWAVGVNPATLRAHLSRAGVPMGTQW